MLTIKNPPFTLADWQYLQLRASVTQALDLLSLPPLPRPVAATSLPAGRISGTPRQELGELPESMVDYEILMRRDDMRQRVRILVEEKLKSPSFEGLTNSGLDAVLIHPWAVSGYVTSNKLEKMGLIYTTTKSRSSPETRWQATALAERLFHLGGLDYISVPARDRLVADAKLSRGFDGLMSCFTKVGRKPIRFLNAVRLIQVAVGKREGGAELLRELHLLGLLRLPERAWQLTHDGNRNGGHRTLRVYPSYAAFRFFGEPLNKGKNPN